MNAKQAKAIVFVCGLLLFAAAVINLQAADYLAALAWAAVAALAAVLYKLADVTDAQSRIIVKGVLPVLKDFHELKETLERGVKATLTMKPGQAPTVRCDLTDEDEEEEEEDDLQQVARQLAEGDIDDLREQGMIQYEASLDIDGKPYTVTLTVEEDKPDDEEVPFPADSADTSEQGAVEE